MGFSRDAEVRCALVLRACPYLQHLALAIDANVCEPPSHADTFALVPRLRSLHLAQDQSHIESGIVFDIRAMLDSLPHLHTLRCSHITALGVTELLDIASHCTLEEVHIEQCKQADLRGGWTYQTMSVSNIQKEAKWLEEDDARLVQQQADRNAQDGEDTAALQAALAELMSAASPPFQGCGEQQSELTPERDEVHRMRAALTRTQPSRRSCEVRLALADWLHRRLQRGGLYSENEHVEVSTDSRSILRCHCLLSILLRTTLQHQLSEFVAAHTVECADLHTF